MSLLALWRGASCSEELLIGRPQRHWIQLTDNFEANFVPKLPQKYHWSYPLQPEIKAAQKQRFRDVERGLRHKKQRSPGPKLFTSHDAFLLQEGRHTLPNPYQEEIQSLPIEPPPLKLLPPPGPRGLEKGGVSLVSSLADLQSLIDDIAKQGCSIVAMEIKASQSSYRGFTAALLLSTDNKDYVIDPFRMYAYLYRINAFTANPNIRKIFFDAPDQILHLQRDFSVYVVNCFDVAVAARLLNHGMEISLPSLVSDLASKTISGKTEDEWLARPLQTCFLESVREETHFLPFIARCLYNQLAASPSSDEACSVEIAQNPNGCTPTNYGLSLLAAVHAESQASCLAAYNFPPFAPLAEAGEILRKFKTAPKDPLLHVLTRLLQWRDIRARIEDVPRAQIKGDELLFQTAKAAFSVSLCVEPVDKLGCLSRDSLREFLLKNREKQKGKSHGALFLFPNPN